MHKAKIVRDLEIVNHVNNTHALRFRHIASFEVQHLRAKFYCSCGTAKHGAIRILLGTSPWQALLTLQREVYNKVNNRCDSFQE